MLQERRWIVGLWKFSDRVPPRELDNIARRWAATDSHYLQLYIRRVAKDQRGIGFTYEIPARKSVKHFQAEYIKQTSTALKTRFLNRFRGWDIASTVYHIK